MSEPRNRSQGDRPLAILVTALDEHREQVMAIPGVNGCGVGFAELGEEERIVIRITVSSPRTVEEVQRKVAQLLGDCPVETVYQPIPQAGVA
jgi:hypothetical protein